MNFELLNTSFELPKSPPLSQHDGDGVEIVGTIVPPNVNLTTWGAAHWSNMLPMSYCTPPLSPLDTSGPQPNMPFLTAILSQKCQLADYAVQIPCYLCKQPFDHIDRLREHLTMHAREMSIHMSPAPAPAPLISPNPCPLPPPATLEIAHLGARLSNNTNLATQLQSNHCPTALKSTKKQYKCHICKKSYKRDTFLAKHMLYKHGDQNKITASLDQLRRVSLDCDQKPRFVWNTKLLNAVAAANYSPATESAAKYVLPTEVSNQQFNLRQIMPRKQKYAPRSPYFNPNLWLNCDAYV